MDWIERFLDWYAGQLRRLPTWAGHTVYLLLWPVLGAFLLTYSALALPVLLLFVLPYVLIFGERWGAKFTRAEVCNHAKKLDQWFSDQITESPDVAACLGVGPELARDFARLVDQSQLTRETAEDFSVRVKRELKGYKGTPFFALNDLSQRLVELTREERRV